MSLGTGIYVDEGDHSIALDALLLMGIGKFPEGYPVVMTAKTPIYLPVGTENVQVLTYTVDSRYALIIDGFVTRGLARIDPIADEFLFPSLSTERIGNQRKFMSAGPIPASMESTILGYYSFADTIEPLHDMPLRAAVTQGYVYGPGETIRVFAEYDIQAINNGTATGVEVALLGRYILPQGVAR